MTSTEKKYIEKLVQEEEGRLLGFIRRRVDREEDDFPRSRWRQKYEAKMNGKVEREQEKEDDSDVIVTE